MTERPALARTIDTDRFSAVLRRNAIDVAGKRLLITRFGGSEQEKDLTEPPNCDGFGRLRHFRRKAASIWPCNPLPIDPACRALGLPKVDSLRAQVFQNAVCNWRCWYCFVDFELLSGSLDHAAWKTADELVELYKGEPGPPSVIDLSGGQPDLTPEWLVWMMEALEQRGLSHSVYLWSDDNLSNDYFWQHLQATDRARIAAYQNYGRVCCFKGYDPRSFSFNTGASPALFDRQFELMRRLVNLGIDTYAYVTLTTSDASGLANEMRHFVDRLQAVDPNLPLRTVPLEVRVYSPAMGRITAEKERAIHLQHEVVECWQAELVDRFSDAERELPIEDVPLGSRG